MSPLKPLRSSRDHAQAMREIERLLALSPAKGSEELDRLEALAILVDAFESDHEEHRIDEHADPIEAIHFHLDRLGKTPKDLEAVLGCSRTRVWEILHRRRSLTLAMVRALHHHLGIPAERLIAEYDIGVA